MQDRQPTYPGRVKLKDVETGAERLYDMTMADEPTVAGDPPTKATLLTDQVASLYGKGPDALPTELFEILSKSVLVGEGGGLATPDGNALGQVKIQLVSYIGNGKYGQSNPCSLTFNFPVDAIFFICVEGVSTDFRFGNYCSEGSQFAVYTKFMSAQNYTPYHGFIFDGRLETAYGKISEDKKTFYWYANVDGRQLNTNGYIYTFIGLNFGEVTT